MIGMLPATAQEFARWDWPRIQPYFDELQGRPLNAANVEQWLSEWSRLAEYVSEALTRLEVATTLDTTDAEAERAYSDYLEQVFQPYQVARQALIEKLLASSLQPSGMEVPIRQLRARAEIFREENLPLQTEEKKLDMDFARILGTQTVVWDGEERTLEQLKPVLQAPDRATRERVWRLMSERQLQDRQAINTLWTRFLDLRTRIAKNAGLPDYREYVWREHGRFAYTPDDCMRFHDAIEAVVVPAATRIYERHRRQLGVESPRPWDTDVDPLNRPPLRPFETVPQLIDGSARIFYALDPTLGGYFDTMRREGLLDLDERKGKGPGGYCTGFAVVGRPFIFMKAVGTHNNLQTLLHEGGHAFHVFESEHLPYLIQRDDSLPIEFAEVASMCMELLAGRYLAAPIGFYDARDAARARIEHLEDLVLFWPYMAVVDSFQHWVYTHVDEARDPANCDAQWASLWRRFMLGQDWSGFDAAMETGWHRKHHIFRFPMYYVEYGLAQLGAVQVWRNSLSDEKETIARYRHALSLGGTASVPDLFAAAGARFQPDAAMLRACVDLIEATIEELEQA